MFVLKSVHISTQRRLLKQFRSSIVVQTCALKVKEQSQLFASTSLQSQCCIGSCWNCNQWNSRYRCSSCSKIRAKLCDHCCFVSVTLCKKNQKLNFHPPQSHPPLFTHTSYVKMYQDKIAFVTNSCSISDDVNTVKSLMREFENEQNVV